MERLTNKREADAQREEYERRLANGYPRNIPEERFLRLAAYEDTGWTPEMLHKLGENAGHMWDFAQAAENMTVGRLKELAEADKDGRVVVLPCKVGDTVYFINAKQILEFTVVGYAADETGISWVYSEHVDKTGHTNERTFSPDRISKTTFLTREEAEKALEAEHGRS